MDMATSRLVASYVAGPIKIVKAQSTGTEPLLRVYSQGKRLRAR